MKATLQVLGVWFYIAGFGLWLVPFQDNPRLSVGSVVVLYLGGSILGESAGYLLWNLRREGRLAGIAFCVVLILTILSWRGTWSLEDVLWLAPLGVVVVTLLSSAAGRACLTRDAGASEPPNN